MVSTRLRRVFHFVNNWINVCIYYLVKISYFIDTIIPKKLNAIAIIVIKKIKLEQAVHRLAELIEDFSPLRQLPAFRQLENELKTVIETAKWNSPC